MKSYIKKAERFAKKHPKVLGQYERTLKLLELNPHHPSLRLHRLSGRLSELYSVSITVFFQITLEPLVSGEKIIPINIGIHDNA